MYKLFADKAKDFKADMRLEGASEDNAFCRLILEAEGKNLLLKGKVNKGGIVVPIQPLRGLFTEGVVGKMKLEVIADNTYFSPWEDDFTIDVSRKVTVEVKQEEPEEAVRIDATSIMVEVADEEPAQEPVVKEKYGKKKRKEESCGKDHGKKKREEVQDINSIVKAFVKEMVKSRKPMKQLRKEFLGKLDPHVQEQIVRASLRVLKEIKR